MFNFLSKYGLAAHLALAAVAPLFLSPSVTLWLTGLAAIYLILEPSRIGSETLHEAHSRTRHAILHDPLFWVLLLLVLMAFVRFFNGGVEMSYDAEAAKWSLSTPACNVLPGCVDGTAFELVSLAFAALVVLMGCRHALGRSARYAFLIASSFYASIGALVWLFLLKQGNETAQAMTALTFENPIFLGTSLGFFLIAATIGLYACFERRWLAALPFASVAVVGNLTGLFLFAPPFDVLVLAGLAILLLLVSFVVIRLTLGTPREFKFLVVFGSSVVLAVFLVELLVPSSLVTAKLMPYLEGVGFFPDAYRSAQSTLNEISRKMWLERPWLGSGLGSYALGLSFSATPADWAVITSLQKAPLNGFWYLLVERGVIGAFLLVVPLALLLLTYAMRLIRGLRKAIPSPLAFVGPFVLASAIALTLFNSSLLVPGALLYLAALIALSSHAFPKGKK